MRLSADIAQEQPASRVFPSFFPHLAGTSNLDLDSARCGGEFRTTFRTIPAPVRLVRNSQALY